MLLKSNPTGTQSRQVWHTIGQIYWLVVNLFCLFVWHLEMEKEAVERLQLLYVSAYLTVLRNFGDSVLYVAKDLNDSIRVRTLLKRTN